MMKYPDRTLLRRVTLGNARLKRHVISYIVLVNGQD